MHRFEPRFPRRLSLRLPTTVTRLAVPGECELEPGVVVALDAIAAAGMGTLSFAAEGDGADLSAVGAELFRDLAELLGLLGLE